MNKKKLVRGSAVAVVLLVIIGAIAGCSNKNHAATTTNASAATATTTTSAPQPATTSTPSTQATTTAAAPPKLKPYRRPASFHIDVTASVAGQHIEVGGTTNLPDGTVLTLNAERDFKQTHDAERVDFLGLNGPTQASVPVHGGHFSGELSAQEHSLAAIMQGDPGAPWPQWIPTRTSVWFSIPDVMRPSMARGGSPLRCGLISVHMGSSCVAVLASGPSGLSRSTRRCTSLPRREFPSIRRRWLAPSRPNRHSPLRWPRCRISAAHDRAAIGRVGRYAESPCESDAATGDLRRASVASSSPERPSGQPSYRSGRSSGSRTRDAGDCPFEPQREARGMPALTAKRVRAQLAHDPR
jgi:hypothetical protein